MPLNINTNTQPLHQRAIIYQKITRLFKRASPAYQVEVGLPNLQMTQEVLRSL